MVHIVASLAFSLIALGASALIFQMLTEERTKIFRALGLVGTAPVTIASRPARLRPAGRWLAAPTDASRRRAAA